MIDLSEWQRRHGITPLVMHDLVSILCAPADITFDPGAEHTEGAGQQRIRLEAPKHGDRLWRNNVGACTDDSGNFIRYGIGNDSTKMNKEIKFPDLIGIRPVMVTQAMVGSRVGVFVGIECKAGGWKFMGTQRELAQRKALNLIQSLGGFATFATGPGDVWTPS